MQTLLEVGSQRRRGVVTEGRHVFVRLSLRLTQPDGVTTNSDDSAQWTTTRRQLDNVRQPLGNN